MPAAILATLFGGAGAGTLAVVVTLLIVDFRLPEPIGALWPIVSVGKWSFGFYV